MGMSDKKILWLLEGYEHKLQNVLVDPTPIADANIRYSKLVHALGMIPKMRKFLEEGRREKAFRWLGFLQCVFWMLDIYTIQELANHSRPSKQDIKEEYPRHMFSTPQIPCGCEICKEYSEAPETTTSII